MSEGGRGPRAGCCADSTEEEGISVSCCLFLTIHIWVVLPLEELIFLKTEAKLFLEYSTITHTAPGPTEKAFFKEVKIEIFCKPNYLYQARAGRLFTVSLRYHLVDNGQWSDVSTCVCGVGVGGQGRAGVTLLGSFHS